MLQRRRQRLRAGKPSKNNHKVSAYGDCHRSGTFLMERQGNTMSGAYIEKNRTGAKPPVSHPQNCKEECPYGYDKAFCFPCYKKLMEEMRSKRKG